MSDCHSCSACGYSFAAMGQARKPFPPGGPKVVVLVGPPNSGKSTLFNRLTGLRQKVANFPGVTVEERMGKVSVDGREVLLIDLPGIYGLEPRSEDERVARDVLFGQMRGVARPDAILLVLDATNLPRHLILAAPVLALGLPTMVLLNMADELTSRGGKVDVEALADQLGAPVALISAVKGQGLETVFEFLAGAMKVSLLAEVPHLCDAQRRYQWAGQIREKVSYHPPAPPLWSRRLDALFLHPIFGPLILCAVIITVFQAMFSWAQPLMQGIQALIGLCGRLLEYWLPDSAWRSLLVDGVLGGTGSVIVFLPQVLLLFLFIGVLEDSGYLARASLIADRTMAMVGLQGKSFIPLLSAYACAVPAILAARTIENKRDRIATILIAPFMTCSARLPVYTLIIAAFLPERSLIGPLLGTRAAALLGLYVLGFTAALGTARLLKSSILRSEQTPFVMEMPPYRWPTLHSLGLRMIDRSKIFLRRAGTVILTVTVLLWAMSHLPLRNGVAPRIEDSLTGTLGRTIEPVIKPLGFNWKIGAGLITALAGREVIIGTLATIYGIEGEGRSGGLEAALRRDLTPGGAVALLVFFAFAMQCMPTLLVVWRETGGWKWPLLQFAYMGVLAYTGALAANFIVTAFLSHS